MTQNTQKICKHYCNITMGAIAPQIISLTIVYSTIKSDADQRKHQNSASLAFVRGLHRGPVNSPHKWPVTRKMFPFDDVIMWYAFCCALCGQMLILPIFPKHLSLTRLPQRQWNNHEYIAWLTHWGLDKMSAISQTTHWNVFSWMKMYEIRLKLQWSLFLKVQLTIFQHWFR